MEKGKVDVKQTKKTIATIFWIISIIIYFYSSAYANFTVKKERPRLLIDKNDVERIRKEIKTYSKVEFLKLENEVNTWIVEFTGEKLKGKRYSNQVLRDLAFVGLINQDQKIIKKAISLAVEIGSTDAKYGNDMVQRPRLIGISYVYDWLYEHLSKTEKAVIRNGIISHIEVLKSFLKKPLFSGGHSRYGNIVIMAGLIALYGDYENWEGYSLLKRVQKLWVNGYNPFQAHVGKDGGYHMGWSYGTPYTSAMPYIIWEKATGQRWGDEWRKNQIYWFLYGHRGDLTTPCSGDCYTTGPLHKRNGVKQIVAINSKVYKNPYAEWFYQNYLTKGSFQIWRILFRDPTLKPISPFDKQNPLPLSRHFRNSGFVVSRSSWDDIPTHLVFKSTPFYTRNHHHKDQNHISLFYKGELLIDSGIYDYYGSKHWLNYYTRTIAHNTLVVFDEEESFINSGKLLSNDGGQKFPKYIEPPFGEEPSGLDDILSEKYRRDGIVGFGENNEACWMRGNGTSAYSNNKVKSYLRDVLMINQPLDHEQAILLILDRVEVKTGLTPRILFHFDNKPILQRKRFEVKNDNGGVLRANVLLPKKLNLELIGGKGKKWFVNGKNYPPTDERMYKNIKGGEWRIELSDNENGNIFTYLTLLAVDDVRNQQNPAIEVALKGAGYYGVLVDKSLILISITDKTPRQWEFGGDNFSILKKIYLAGVDSEGPFTFKINEEIFTSTSDNVVLIQNVIPEFCTKISSTNSSRLFFHN